MYWMHYLLCGLGAAVFVRFLYNLFWAYRNVFLINQLPNKFHGTVAVVTGTTSGLGEEWVRQLVCDYRCKILMLSRNEEKMQEIRQKYIDSYNANIEYMVVDMSTHFDTDPIVKKFREMSVARKGILINNAGLSYDHPETFPNVEPNRLEDIIDVNCRSMTRLTRALLPEIEDGGMIVNVSSLLGCIPSPLLSVYAASKAYVNQFTRSLSIETRKRFPDVSVKVVAPALVVSKMSKMRKSSLMVPSAATFVRSALNRLGNNAVFMVPYWPHYLQYCVMSTLPGIVALYLYNTHSALMLRARKIGC